MKNIKHIIKNGNAYTSRNDLFREKIYIMKLV